jgi:hypothetical protein
MCYCLEVWLGTLSLPNEEALINIPFSVENELDNRLKRKERRKKRKEKKDILYLFQTIPINSTI